MDPESCLDEAEAALCEGDLDRCQERLAEYHDWRDRLRGFAPAGGDRRWRAIAQRCLAAREARPE